MMRAHQTTQSSNVMDLHHPLLREFPDHRSTIHLLKVSDEEFRRMFDEYHHADDAVARIEEEVDFATDQEIDELKVKRARLKDELYRRILGGATATR